MRHIHPRALVVVLALAVSASAGPEEDSDRALAATVRDLVEVMEGDDRDAGEAAAKKLGRLGVDAVFPIIRMLPPDSAWDAWDRLFEAFETMGVESALAELTSLRDDWPHSRRMAVDGLESALRDRLPQGKIVRVKLRPGALSDPLLVPLPLRFPVVDGLPLDDTLLPGFTVSFEAGSPVLRGADGKRTATGAKPGKPTVTTFGEGEQERTIAFFDLLDEWFAGPASVLVGKLDGQVVELLDGDQDGRFDGAADYLRYGQCFQRHPRDRLVQVKKGLMSYRLTQGSSGPVLELRPEPFPKWAKRAHVQACEWLNAWRGRSGLPALRLNKTRSAACLLHSRYMSRWGVGHDEDREAEGWTAAGARAGKCSSLSADGNPTSTFKRIVGTVLHRNSCIGRTEEGIGVGYGSGGSVLWGQGSAERETGQVVCVPGPGERGVELICLSERPTPDHDAEFYNQARGYPISVTFGETYDSMRGARIEVFTAKSRKALPGTLFTPEKPYTKARASNFLTAHFVADAPLDGGTTYIVRFTGTHHGIPVRHVWSFTTR